MNKNMIGEALQQMVGFKLAKWGADVNELVSSMGLTKNEWEHIKRYEDSGHLDEEDVKSINNYFKNKSNKEIKKAYSFIGCTNCFERKIYCKCILSDFHRITPSHFQLEKFKQNDALREKPVVEERQ